MAKQYQERVGGVGAVCVFLIALMAAPLTAPSAWSAEGYGGGIFPLGERNPPPKFPDKPVPFKSIEDLPARPALGIEIGDPFLDTGKLDAGFETPWGAVWQPRLWGYMIYRTAFQHFETATRANNEWANRLDVFLNLQLTGTEKILLNLRPRDTNRPTEFTRYSFDDPRGGEGYVGEYNSEVEALFFEGDLGSLIPAIDRTAVGTTQGN